MGWFLRSVLLYSDILKFLPSKEKKTESAVDEKTGKPRSSSALLQESAQGVAGGRDGAVSLPITLWPLLPRGCPEHMSACGTNKETRLSDEVGGTISFRTK